MKSNQTMSRQFLGFIGALLMGVFVLVLTATSGVQGQRRPRTIRASPRAVPSPTPAPSPIVFARLKKVTLWKLPSRDGRAQALENVRGSYIPRNVYQSAMADVEFGEPLTLLAEQKGFEEYGRWYKVTTRDESKTGWVHSFLVTNSKDNIDKITISRRIPTLLMISGRYTPEGFKRAAYRVQGYLEESQYNGGVIKLLPGQAVYFPVDWNFVDYLEMRNYANEFSERPSMQMTFIVNDVGKLEPWRY